jgi:hypothetical protein
VRDDGISGLTTVLQRKGGENVSTLGATTSALVIFVVLVCAIALWRRPPRTLELVTTRVPTLLVATLPLIVLGALGYALNDSGIAVPAIMLTVVAATIAYTSAAMMDPAGQPGPTPGVDRSRNAR